MDEREWLTCAKSQAMLAFLYDAGKLSERKTHLFMAACCRRIWGLVNDERTRKAVEVVERYAEGLASRADLAEAGSAADAAFDAAMEVATEAEA